MIRVSATEFQRNIGRYQDEARRGPVVVTSDGQELTVLISTEEYRRLKRHDRQVLGFDDFTEADIALLEKAHAPEEAKAFDAEVTT